MVDELAGQNTISPFAASLVLSTPESDGIKLLGKTCHDFLATAEDKLLSATIIDSLLNAIKQGEDKQIIFTSNAQPCAEAHAKYEMLAHQLHHAGHIKPGEMIVHWGVGLDELVQLQPAFDDTSAYPDMRGTVKPSLVTITKENYATIPMHLLNTSGAPSNNTALLVNARHEMLQRKQRTPLSVTACYATAELECLQAEKEQRQQAGIEQFWDLSDTKLYTTAPVIGPALYAACQWTGAKIVQFPSITAKEDTDIYRECIGLDQRDFFNMIAHAPDLSGNGLITYIANPNHMIGRKAIKAFTP